MRWNKYTLITTTEAEDLISSMMMDVGIEGIEIEDKVPLSEQDKSQMFVDILPEGPEDDGVARISFYLEPETDNAAVLAAVQKGLDEIRGWGIDVGAGTIEASQTEDKDWINNWKEYFHQFYVDDILIKPSWEEVQPKDRDKLLIQIDPGTAFGTGMHETTQLCIRQLRKYMKAGDRVLDVGCGSGILSVAALKLGAGAVVGTDIDEACLTSTRDNFDVNHLSHDLGTFYCGNLIDDAALREMVGGGYDIVVANILADVIVPMADVLFSCLRAGGICITSGIIDFKETEVASALTAAGFAIAEITYQGEWVSITVKKE